MAQQESPVIDKLNKGKMCLYLNEEFLEYKVFNNFYGSTRTPVIDKLK